MLACFDAVPQQAKLTLGLRYGLVPWNPTGLENEKNNF